MKKFLDQKVAHLDTFRERMTEFCDKMEANELGLQKLRQDVHNFLVSFWKGVGRGSGGGREEGVSHLVNTSMSHGKLRRTRGELGCARAASVLRNRSCAVLYGTVRVYVHVLYGTA